MPKLIAVIDDDPEMEFVYSYMFEASLNNKSVELKFFEDSREFFDWYFDNEPDLILTDINMPHLTGPDLAFTVKRLGRTTPTYFVSGDEEKDYKEIMERLGVCRFLSKPLDFQHIRGVIESDLNVSLS